MITKKPNQPLQTGAGHGCSLALDNLPFPACPLTSMLGPLPPTPARTPRMIAREISRRGRFSMDRRPDAWIDWYEDPPGRIAQWFRRLESRFGCHDGFFISVKSKTWQFGAAGSLHSMWKSIDQSSAIVVPRIKRSAFYMTLDNHPHVHGAELQVFSAQGIRA